MDLQQAFDEGFDALKGYVDRSFGVFAKQIEALEQKLADLPAPKDGKDADQDAIADIVLATIAPDLAILRSTVEAIPPAPDIPAMIAEAIEAAKSEPVDIKALVDTAVAAIERPQDGKDADPELVASLVKTEAERILAGWGRPKDGVDGKSVTLEDISIMAQTMFSKRFDDFMRDVVLPENGKDGKDGRNGLDAVEFFRGQDGHLIVTMSNGTTRDLGQYIGKDGSPGSDGKPGTDGVGFDDMDLVETDQGIVLRFTKGEVVKDFRLPIVTDRGVFKEGTEYRKGDGVTYGGSFWIAQETTSDKPDTGKGFRLAVKRGRDGKDGILKDPPKGGPVKVG